MPILLNKANLSKITNNIVKPDFFPEQSKICHIGVGNFHRSHQAVYTQEAMQQSGDKNWGICGIGIMEQEYLLHNKLAKQDGLYTVITKSNNQQSLKIISSINNFLHISHNLPQVYDKIADSNTSLVTLTITEGGYYLNQNTGKFDIDHVNVIHDLELYSRGGQPKTIYGLLAQALIARKNKSNKPITLLSCDNISSNGDKFKNSFYSFIENNKRLANHLSFGWLDDHITFPNSMVDRITPVSNSEDIDYCADHGYLDASPVGAESYIQWIIEDKFCSSRPEWEYAGAEFVKDVLPYENIKLRLLNGTHQALSYPGILMGYEYVHEATNDDLINQFIRLFMSSEASLCLQSLPGLDLNKYQQDVITRFSNSNIKDSLERIVSFSSDRMVSFVLPTVFDNLKNNNKYNLSAFLLASWYYYLVDFFSNDNINPDRFNDNNKELLQELVNNSLYHNNPEIFLENQQLFNNLISYNNFVDLFCRHYFEIKNQGIKQALYNLLLSN